MSPDDRDGMLRYDELTSRVYTETRMPAGTRDLILALGWVTLRDPRRHNPAEGIWVRTRDVLNADNKRMWQLVADDVPRYDSELHDKSPMGCQAPMVRAKRLCGRSTMHGFSERDPATGWLRYWGFCNRPRCREYMAPIWERAKDSRKRAPEPIPNAGGLLPLFFSWNWESKYSKAMELIKYRSTWEPPTYGLSADEWPSVPGAEPVKAFPKLRLATSGGDVVVAKESGPTLVTANAAQASAARSNLLAELRRTQFSVVNLPRQTSPSKGDQVT
ncbi:hypothetical protein ACGFU4_36305 [Streptomyces sp. NPDC048511]|uniref:hypothetical protein n=1 Tax=Streptomyces sp. NPDC048511 TaxID=3365562 RepID=UPI003718EB8B